MSEGHVDKERKRGKEKTDDTDWKEIKSNRTWINTNGERDWIKFDEDSQKAY